MNPQNRTTAPDSDAVAEARRHAVGLVLVKETEHLPEHIQVQVLDTALNALSDGQSAHQALTQGRAVIQDHLNP